jgi:hypothetical protein
MSFDISKQSGKGRAHLDGVAHRQIMLLSLHSGVGMMTSRNVWIAIWDLDAKTVA